MVTVIAIGALVLAAAALAQGVRIGLTRGDWSGLIPVVVIAAFVVLAVVLGDFSTGD